MVITCLNGQTRITVEPFYDLGTWQLLVQRCSMKAVRVDLSSTSPQRLQKAESSSRNPRWPWIRFTVAA